MKKTLFFLLFVVSFLSCRNKEKKTTATTLDVAVVDSLLITDSTWGLVSADIGFDHLEKLYGHLISRMKESAARSVRILLM